APSHLSMVQRSPSSPHGVPAGSSRQVDEQQSPSKGLPSSHSSPASSTRLPHGAVASCAPMSQAGTCGRVTPRWSVAGHPTSSPASIAGLPGSRARVKVGPPLSRRTPSCGSVALRSPGPERPHVPSLSRLWPSEVTSVLPQSPPAVLLATIVFLSVKAATRGKQAPRPPPVPSPRPGLAPLLLTVLLMTVPLPRIP